MKNLNLRFWILAGWLSVSLVFVTSVTDIRLMLAALANLYFCVSALKTHEKNFKEILDSML